MRIEIIDVDLVDSTTTNVRFECVLGIANARWGTTRRPATLGGRDVEFAVTEKVDCSSIEVIGDKTERPSIMDHPQGVRLCGSVEAVEDDGVVTFRLGEDVLLLEGKGRFPPPGSVVCLVARGVEVYEYEL